MRRFRKPAVSERPPQEAVCIGEEPVAVEKSSYTKELMNLNGWLKEHKQSESVVTEKANRKLLTETVLLLMELTEAEVVQGKPMIRRIWSSGELGQTGMAHPDVALFAERIDGFLAVSFYEYPRGGGTLNGFAFREIKEDIPEMVTTYEAEDIVHGTRIMKYNKWGGYPYIHAPEAIDMLRQCLNNVAEFPEIYTAMPTEPYVSVPAEHSRQIQ